MTNYFPDDDDDVSDDDVDDAHADGVDADDLNNHDNKLWLNMMLYWSHDGRTDTGVNNFTIFVLELTSE